MTIMMLIPCFIMVLQLCFCQNYEINKKFEIINNFTLKYYQMAAEIAWNSSINPNDPELVIKSSNYQREHIFWQHQTCDELSALENRQLLNETQLRQSYLLCRGPKYTFNEARESSTLYEDLQSIYSNAQICIPNNNLGPNSSTSNIEGAILDYLSKFQENLKLGHNSVAMAAKLEVKDDGKSFCIKGENEVEKLMEYSRNEAVLKWLWFSWREKVGPPMKEPYKDLVTIENQAAIRNGYSDVGETWRDELEIPNVRQLCHRLYSEVKPLYKLIHGVVRFYLRQHHGNIVPKYEAIPAHLLGNLWSQNWESLSDIIIKNDINLNESILKQNWTVTHMIKRAEDFYQSMGLPPMTKEFWRNSVFSREANDARRCHGSAADMFKDGDYRLLYCAGTSFEDFYVMHHEFGHIQYYMAYSKQPAIFRQGANTAIHESIGDAIMLGVITPQHLHRLGLINDSLLYPQDYVQETRNSKRDPSLFEYNVGQRDGISKLDLKLDLSSDEIFILKQALNNLPQIPFSLLLDEYRWRYFEGSLKEDGLNKEFWDMALVLQGISPPGERGEEYFDVAAKFHVPDNTPYIRYFLSSFLRHQIFESVCKTAVFGRRSVKESLPKRITMNRCDIYGSKAAGKLLKDLMSRGSSQNWREILQATTGRHDLSASPLLHYYRPLEKTLKRLVDKYNIPIGW